MEKITIKALTEKGKEAIKITAIDNKKFPKVQRILFNTLFKVNLSEDYSTYELIVKPSKLSKYPEPLKNELRETMLKNGATETDFIIEVI